MKIISPCRIHMGLIDMNGSVGRIDGGIGATLDHPNCEISGKESNEIEIEFSNSIMNNTPEEDLKSLHDRIYNSAKNVLSEIGQEGVYLQVNEVIPAHTGLGSGTQVSLSTGKLTSSIYGHDLDAYSIAKLTGRGGTSGIGVSGFEFGGFIVDGGHSFGESGEKTDYRPSSASKNVKPAPLLFRHDFNWEVVLTIPKIPTEEQVSDKKEVDIFKKYCPVPEDYVNRFCRLVLMKMMPAVIENNMKSFGECINEIQGLGFKGAEVQLQNSTLKNLLKHLQNTSYSGLSSFGPTIYSLGDKKEIMEQSNEFFDKEGLDGEIIVSKGNNTGYKLI
ncbi:beta-ribofuranosylaminobenzene 5'-phosphate synthase [Methanococcus voltae]|uniref:beta-ribofuranosylaminobenzene 5'-phosphate synthase n=1 Tax=Methanococcus voltae TaxID=2188 RepID=UPI001AEA2AC3|nr:beta-ribofuranosylaminobenzene 5'-phosphate synthase [Methanococcus voltae]MBP2143300.1 beta-ribofuranosylaminobenzene 5'-phosphate synthase [Methanococcus voltae]